MLAMKAMRKACPSLNPNLKMLMSMKWMTYLKDPFVK
jgi:hypothetical protein